MPHLVPCSTSSSLPKTSIRSALIRPEHFLEDDPILMGHDEYLFRMERVTGETCYLTLEADERHLGIVKLIYPEDSDWYRIRAYFNDGDGRFGRHVGDHDRFEQAVAAILRAAFEDRLRPQRDRYRARIRAYVPVGVERHRTNDSRGRYRCPDCQNAEIGAHHCFCPVCGLRVTPTA